MPGIELCSVGRRYGNVAAVDDVSLSIEEGEFLTLLGPSGCGKTTTLRIVAGLEQNTSGRVLIGDGVVSDAERGYFLQPDRRHLGMVFQSYAIWPHMTVFENVAYPLRVRHVRRREVHDKVMAALKLVEMEDYAARPAPALSGGQQQRVAIARALANEPRVLLLDEPLSNLDAKLRTQTGDEFRALQQRLGVTTLYVTHDQQEAMALSDRVAVMDKGRVLQCDRPEAVYLQPRNRQVAAFFGNPNIIEATVEACEALADGRSRVRLRVGHLVVTAYAGQAFEAKTPALLIIRPERVRLVDADSFRAEGSLSVSGRVEGSTYRGTHRSVVIVTEIGRLNADLTDAPRAGAATVQLHIRPEDMWAIPREDTP